MFVSLVVWLVRIIFRCIRCILIITLRFANQSSQTDERANVPFVEEFTEVCKRYGVKHLCGFGYGAWNTVNIAEEIVQEYFNCHKSSSNDTGRV